MAGQRRRRRRESKEGDAKSRCVHGLLHVAMAPRALVALKQEAGKEEELEEGGGGGGFIYNQQEQLKALVLRDAAQTLNPEP